MGKCAAPVNIGDQQAGSMGVQCHAHVDDVARFEVDLGGRACAFNHDHIVLGHQLVQSALHRRPDAFAAIAPRGVGQLVVHLPQQNDLAVGVALGFEQERIHANLWHGIGGKRLEVLGAADLTPIHHPGVVAHVLRLEGRDFEPLTGVVATQRGGQPAFASSAGGA